jgi:hypothetical protein
MRVELNKLDNIDPFARQTVPADLAMPARASDWTVSGGNLLPIISRRTDEVTSRWYIADSC